MKTWILRVIVHIKYLNKRQDHKEEEANIYICIMALMIFIERILKPTRRNRTTKFPAPRTYPKLQSRHAWKLKQNNAKRCRRGTRVRDYKMIMNRRKDDRVKQSTLYSTGNVCTFRVRTYKNMVIYIHGTLWRGVYRRSTD